MTPFPGAFIRNADKMTDRKSLLICGAARGGTSFAASVFHRLGVPFTRSPGDLISRRLEHGGLKKAFQADDAAALQGIVDDFRGRFPVWGWKLPAIERRLSRIAKIVPDAHAVLIFKDPLAVAARIAERKGKSPFAAIGNVLRVYQRMAEIVATPEVPMLVISYDRAMAELPAFLEVAADFAGVPSYDKAAVIAGVREDAGRYFEGWVPSRSAPG